MGVQVRCGDEKDSHLTPPDCLSCTTTTSHPSASTTHPLPSQHAPQLPLTNPQPTISHSPAPYYTRTVQHRITPITVPRTTASAPSHPQPAEQPQSSGHLIRAILSAPRRAAPLPYHLAADRQPAAAQPSRSPPVYAVAPSLPLWMSYESWRLQLAL